MLVRDVNPKLMRGIHKFCSLSVKILTKCPLRAANYAMTVDLKCRNEKIRAKRAENKVKPSNIDNNLVNAREALQNLSFCNDGKYEVYK